MGCGCGGSKAGDSFKVTYSDGREPETFTSRSDALLALAKSAGGGTVTPVPATAGAR